MRHTEIIHALPADFRRALNKASLIEIWRGFTPLARNEWTCWIISAKKSETRNRRIEVGIDKIKKGMRRPCCWAGCPHR